MANVLYSRLGSGPLSATQRVWVFAKPVPIPFGWLAQPVQPLFRRAPLRTEHVFAGFLEAVRLDKWQPRATEPVRARLAVPQTGHYDRPILEILSLDKWWRQPSEPVRLPREVARAGQTTPLFIERIQLDKWYAPPSEPVRARPEPVRAQVLAWQWVETIGLDKWWRQPSEPVRGRAEPTRTGVTSFLPVETFTVDKWMPQPAEPVRSRAEPNRSGYIVAKVETQQVVLLSQWYAPASEPVRQRPEPPRVGCFSWPSLEIVTLEKWWRQPSDPVRTPREPARVGCSAFIRIEPVTVDKWQLQASEPVRGRPALVRGQDAAFQWVSMITVDRWFQQSADPVRSRAEPVRFTNFAFTKSPEVVTVDKWASQPPDPVRFRPETVRTGLAVAPILLVGEMILVDRWYTQPSEPVRARAEAVRAGLHAWQIATVRETITVDKWWTQPSEPVRFRPEAVRGGLHAWQVSTAGETVLVDKWFTLAPDLRRLQALALRAAGGVSAQVFIVTFDARSGFPWPEPERRPLGATPAAWFQAYGATIAQPFTEVIYVDKFANQYVDYFRAKSAGLWEGRYAYIEPTHAHPSDTTLAPGYGWQQAPGVGSVDWNPEPGPPPPSPVIFKPLKGPDEETCEVFLKVWAAHSTVMMQFRRGPHAPRGQVPDPTPLDQLVPGGIHKDKLYPGIPPLARPYAMITSKQGRDPSFSTGGRFIDYREVTIDVYGVGDVATSEIIPVIQALYNDQPLSWIGVRANVHHIWTEALEVTVTEQDEVKQGEEYRAARLRWMVWTDRQTHNRVRPDN